MCKNIYLCVHCSIFIHLLLLYTGSWEMACSSNAVRKWHSFIPRSSLTQWLLTTVVCRYHIIVYSIHVCLIVSVHFVYNDQIFNSKGDTVLKKEKRNKWCVLSSPCQNNGTCIMNQSSYECKCHAGYIGNHCESDQNECAMNLCPAKSTCYNEDGGYTCIWERRRKRFSTLESKV